MSEEALRRAHEALDVWRNTYAADMVSADDAYGAANRLADEGGTLAYIARVQESIRAALSEGQAPEPDFLASLHAAFPELDGAQLSAVTRYAMSLTDGAAAQQAPEPVAQEPVAWMAHSVLFPDGEPMLTTRKPWADEWSKSPHLYRVTPLAAAGMDAARAKAIEADAARYRWLRDSGSDVGILFANKNTRHAYGFFESFLTGEELDAAIDRALATKGAGS